MNGAAPENGRTLREEAVDWFSLKRSGDMSAAEIAAFAEWLASDPRAQQQFDRLQRHWDMLAAVADDPAILAVRERDLRAFNRPGRVRMLLGVAAALVLMLTSVATLMQNGFLDQYWGSSRGETFQTGTGQRTTATLSDGSIVTLDAESELRVVEMAATRRLQLVRGHAFFQVAKDPLHPFLVEAAGKIVRAVGTKFDVRLDDDAAVTVTLVEGKVRVEQSRGWLRPEQRADMAAGAKLVASPDQNWKLTRVDAASETSWLSGRLTFMGEPLGAAIAEVNRYSRQKIVFADGAVPDTQIVGVFAAGDVDGFVTAMQLNGIARVVDRSDTEIRLARARSGDADPPGAPQPQ